MILFNFFLGQLFSLTKPFGHKLVLKYFQLGKNKKTKLLELHGMLFNNKNKMYLYILLISFLYLFMSSGQQTTN